MTESSHSTAPRPADPAPATQAVLAQVAENRKRLRTLAELIADATLMSEPEAVLPQLAYVGRCTLLSAREKLGKSTLLSQGAVAVTQGGFFLGARVRQGRVLWYALDEPFKDAVQRFHRFGADPTQIVLPEHPLSASVLEADCAEWQPVLVVIDTLSRLLFANGIDLMNGRAIAGLLAPYLAVIQRCGAALVLLHHTNRKGEEYTGSIHLGAIVDGPLTLKKVKGRPLDVDDDEDDDDDEMEGEGMPEIRRPSAADADLRRVLEGQTRWGPVKLVLEFDSAAGRYVMYTLGQYLIDRITTDLAKAPGGMSGNELARAIGGNRAAVLRCLRRGELEGRWYRKGNKWYREGQ